jgi:pyruvate kinase
MARWPDLPSVPAGECDRDKGAGLKAAVLLDRIRSLRQQVLAYQALSAGELAALPPSRQVSALNLQHYLALRNEDLRDLQEHLARLGLSSLGRSEGHVLATLNAVSRALSALAGVPESDIPPLDGAPDFDQSRQLLHDNTASVLGEPAADRKVQIMVTMPTEAATDHALVHNLLERGMNCIRINCAHDDRSVWQGMIDNLARAREALQLPCRISMDLAGPKLRTGCISDEPKILKVKPRRDSFGCVTAPGLLWLSAQETTPMPSRQVNGQVCVDQAWLDSIRAGAELRCLDTRGARRKLQVVEVLPQGILAATGKTLYLGIGTVLENVDVSADKPARTAVTMLPGVESSLALQKEELLLLTADCHHGNAAVYDETGTLLKPASIGCTIPEVFQDVRVGEAVWFDDGRIGALVEAVTPQGLQLRIRYIKPQGDRLKAGKGINFPDSRLQLPALTVEDRDNLAFVCAHADIVEMSFASSVRDIDALAEAMAPYERQPAVVLKIETRRGFENLPAMLFRLMRLPRCGVMIARGDLAVENGFVRLAELQEEILWLSEAAHLPVIWATQVLETMARKGQPTRAEITDAAMSDRAECVMLNKGPYIIETVEVLVDILHRMQLHQEKKSSLLRKLHLGRH